VRDVFTWTSMVFAFVQSGMLDEARRIFDEKTGKRKMTYNVMIAGYVQYKKMDMARELFEAMPCRNVGSWNTMISGYGHNKDIAQGRNEYLGWKLLLVMLRLVTTKKLWTCW